MSLRRVINGTGVVLHTNLGRARLSRAAIEAVCRAGRRLFTLEYDPAAGRRGSRHDHVEYIITRITGCGSGHGGQQQRGGNHALSGGHGKRPGNHHIPGRTGGDRRFVPYSEIMEESGAYLREVGTTNKTKYRDYEAAVGENTGALLKVPYQQL